MPSDPTFPPSSFNQPTLLPSSPPALHSSFPHSDPNAHAAPPRPNHFTGFPQTWRTFTAPDRAIHESLATLAAADLSRHLFNVHVLSRTGQRAREVLQARDAVRGDGPVGFPGSEREEGGDDRDEDIMGDERYVVPKGWTAWPVRRERLPRNLRIRIGGEEEEEEEGDVYKGPRAEGPREVVMEELVGFVLRVVKERFRARLDAERRIRTSIEGGGKEEGAEKAEAENSVSDDSESGSDSHESSSASASDSDSDSNSDSDSDSGKDEEDSETEEQDAQFPDETASTTSDETYYEAALSTDDALSTKIFTPPISSILSKLDTLLTRLHTTRLAAVTYTYDRDTASLSPSPTGSPSKTPPSTTAPEIPIDPALTASFLPPPKKSLYKSNWLATWRPRPWHVILHTATPLFPPSVLHRTAQRCADLFDSPATIPSTPPVAIPPRSPATRYAPVDPTILSLTTDSNDNATAGPFSPSPPPPPVKTPGLHYCRVATCPRHTKPFPKWANYARHIKGVHRLSPSPPPSRSRSLSHSQSPSRSQSRGGETTDTEGDGDGDVDSEDEMEEDVHVDGYLREFRLKRGWRGLGVGIALGGEKKRRKTGTGSGTLGGSRGGSLGSDVV